MRFPSGEILGWLTQPVVSKIFRPIGNSSCWRVPSSRTTANCVPSGLMSASLTFSRISCGAPPARSDAREGPERDPGAGVPAVEQDRHLAVLRHADDVGRREFERARLDAVEPRRVDPQRLVSPRRTVDDGLPVRSEPGGLDEAAVVGDLTKGRKRRRAQSSREQETERRPRRGRPSPARAGFHHSRFAGVADVASCVALVAAHRGLEREGEVARRLEALLRPLLEAVPHDALDAGGNRPRRLREARGGSSCAIAVIVSAAVSPRKARSPESIS